MRVVLISRAHIHRLAHDVAASHNGICRNHSKTKREGNGMQIPEGEYRVGTDDDYYVRTNVWSAPGCHGAACGAILHIKDGKFVDIEGDESNPITQGRLCIKCLNMTEFEYHPERIIYPMKRDPKDRGKNAWERITWDEAYDLIEENYNKVVEKTGTPNAVLTLGGTGREATMFYPVISFADFRSANVAAPISGDSCYGPRCMMAANIFGSGYPEVDSGMFFDDKYNDPRFERPEYMIVWGSNPLVSNPAGYFGHQIIDMMKMGTKLIVVDPQITWMGSRAEHVLQLRPGTDAALAIGMLKVIVDEDIYDKEFVEKWVYGFDWLVERINKYSYEEIEKLTQVPTEQMRTVARAYATADGTGRNCSIFMGVAMEMQTEALSDIQAVLSLIAITGNVDELLAAERTHLHEAIGGLSEFAGTLGENAGRVDSILRSVNAMAGELSEQEFASNLAGSVEELNALLEKLNEQQGTLGKLVGDAALYDSLTEASGNLATLLEDLKQYPARYVHLSLFGRDPEKMKARAERRAAKEAARAERDSLKRAAQQ